MRVTTFSLILALVLGFSGLALAEVELGGSLKELPLPNGAKALSSANMQGIETANLEAPASPKEIVNFYKQAMSAAGWKQVLEQSTQEVHMVSFQKEQKSLTVSCEAGQDGKSAFAIILTLGK